MADGEIPEGMVRAWAQATDPTDPLDALVGVKQLREELAAWEADLGRRVLAAGGTWDTIGSALGISRQAAWQRLRGGIEAAIAREREQVEQQRRQLAETRAKLKRERRGRAL